jgi:GTP cyclohydrolase I
MVMDNRRMKGKAYGAVRELLAAIEPRTHTRQGLTDTPHRVAKAWLDEWASGYGQDPGAVLKVFNDGGEQYDEMIVIRGIPVYSHCEHHMASIFGTATVAYIPSAVNQQIVGLSKASRLVDIFAKRLQVQERLTVQIADALNTHLQPTGVGVLLQCRHMCMESRGVRQPGVHTITSALRGAIKDQPATRAEFLAVAMGGK